MNYVETKESLHSIGAAAAILLKSMGSASLLSDFSHWQTDLETDVFTVVVVGEFNRGKSSLLNALFDLDILPVGATPTTATVTILQFSPNPRIRVHYINDRVQDLEYSPTAIEEFIAFSGTRDIDYVEVGLPHPLLRAGIVYVDTPGVADLNRDRIEVTYRFVPRADAVLFVLDSTQLVTLSEVDFLQSTILNDGIERLLFVSNFSDLLEEDARDQVVSRAKNRLAEVLGKEDIPVILVSARQASLQDQRAQSGIDELSVALRAIGLDGPRGRDKVSRMRQRLSAIILSAKTILSVSNQSQGLNSRNCASSLPQSRTNGEIERRRLTG